jgi:hypothetical protein
MCDSCTCNKNDDLVTIDIDLSDDAFLKISKLAHEAGITFNEYCVCILEEYVLDNRDDVCDDVESRDEEYLDDRLSDLQDAIFESIKPLEERIDFLEKKCNSYLDIINNYINRKHKKD